MGKYLVLIGDWVGKTEADTDVKAKIKGIKTYKEETGSVLGTVDLLPFVYPRRLKERDITMLQILEERARDSGHGTRDPN